MVPPIFGVMREEKSVGRGIERRRGTASGVVTYIGTEDVYVCM